MAPRKNTAAIATYGDHEVIVPENKLRKAISAKAPDEPNDDPVARAEQALARELRKRFDARADLAEPGMERSVRAVQVT